MGQGASESAEQPRPVINAMTARDIVHHASYAPGTFPKEWLEVAFGLHCVGWPSPWEGQLSRNRFDAEVASTHVDTLFRPAEDNGEPTLLAFLKWKATDSFCTSRDRLADPALVSLSGSPPAGHVCAFEITATTEPIWRGLGRRLLGEAMAHWAEEYREAVYCTYSPKRKLTRVLRQLAERQQQDRPALEVFAHRASAVAARRIDGWVASLGQPLEAFIRHEIVPVPDQEIMGHLATLKQRYRTEVIDGVVAAIGFAYNFVLWARSGQPASGPAAFHRTLGAEHWRQYPASATNCADALGLVDHWRYSNDPDRRAKCARLFKLQRTSRSQEGADPKELLVLG